MSGHWDYFASLGARGAAVASRSRLRGHGISRDLGKKPLEDDFQGSTNHDDVKFSVGCALNDRGEGLTMPKR